jgi:carbonic anhydrase/acetyltransferase-like protein (isoleucine patch superfamily)
MAAPSAQLRFWSKFVQSWGRSFDGIGNAMQGNLAYTEVMGTHRTATAFQATLPKLDAKFVAPCASVIGDVRMAAGSSAWYGAVLRGDVNTITVGTNSHIGDRTVVHVASDTGSVSGKALPTTIGDNVNVGAVSILHACTIQNGATIGTGAQVLDGASVGVGSVVEAGAVVSPGKQVPAGEVWGGVPAKFIRKVSPDEAGALSKMATDVSDLAAAHADELGKTWAQVEQDKLEAYDAATRDPDYNPEYKGVWKPEA